MLETRIPSKGNEVAQHATMICDAARQVDNIHTKKCGRYFRLRVTEIGDARDGVAVHWLVERAVRGALPQQLLRVPGHVLVVEGHADVPRRLQENNLKGVHTDAIVRTVP